MKNLLRVIVLAVVPFLASAITVAEINGNRYLSGLNGQGFTNLTALVTAKGPNGVFIRSTTPDNDERTSESVYVFDRTIIRNVSVGDIVMMDGNVSEYRSSSTYVYLTEVIRPRNVQIVSSNNTIKPVVLGGRTTGIIGKKSVRPPTEQYSFLDNGDVFGVPNGVSLISSTNPQLTPANFGMDFWESLSGELVTVSAPTALGRQANAFGDQWVYGNWKVTGLNSRGGLTVTDRDSNPETLIVGTPLDGTKNPNTTKLGDSLEDITGVIQSTFGFYYILPLTALRVRSSRTPASAPATSLLSSGKCNGVTIGQYNVENLAPNSTNLQLIAQHIANYMKTPSIVFVQEIQDNDGPTNDGVVNANITLSTLASAIQKLSGVSYSYANIDPVNDEDGGQPGGNIRVAYLYNPADVRLYRPNPGGPTDQNVVQAGPTLRYNPGRIEDPTGGTFENSRKPLAAQWETLDGRSNFFTVNVHLTSKGGSSSLEGDPRPPNNGGIDQRNAQANVTGSFISQILAQDSDAAIIAAGDWNEFAFVEPLETFVRVSGLRDMDDVSQRPAVERYTYTFGSSQQQLDHMYVSPSVAQKVSKKDFDHVHVNSWAALPDVASDHDPSVARLNLCRPRR